MDFESSLDDIPLGDLTVSAATSTPSAISTDNPLNGNGGWNSSKSSGSNIGEYGKKSLMPENATPNGNGCSNSHFTDQRRADTGYVDTVVNAIPCRSMRWKVQLGLLEASHVDRTTSKHALQPLQQLHQQQAVVAQHRQRYRQLCQEFCPTLPALYGENGPQGSENQAKTLTTTSNETPTAAVVAVADAGTSVEQQQQQQPSNDVNLDLDPLTAMVQEQTMELQRQQAIELQYQKDRKRMQQNGTKHGPNAASSTVVYEEEADPVAAYEQLIVKDLHRLPYPHVDSVPPQTPKVKPSPPQTPHALRQSLLHRILLVFACTHNEAGYLQGMHEIASYVLYALELEKDEYKLDEETDTTANVHEDNTATTIEADCFVLTEHILTSLFVAYDVVLALPTLPEAVDAVVASTATTNMPHVTRSSFPQQQQRQQQQPFTRSHGNDKSRRCSPLDEMAQRIIALTAALDCPSSPSTTASHAHHAYTQHPPAPTTATAALSTPVLHRHVQACFTQHVPPTLIFTKWIRLLLSREVCVGKPDIVTGHISTRTHADVVLRLWDALFAAAYQVSVQRQQGDAMQGNRPQPPYSPNGSTAVTNKAASISSLQYAAEALCAARLWHHGHTIIHLCSYPDVLLQWLMNIPPESAESSLADIIERMWYIVNSSTMTNDSNQRPFPFRAAPPPIPPAVLALTASHPRSVDASYDRGHHERAATHQSSGGGSSSLWDNPSLFLSTAAPRLSVFTEQLAAKTQSFQKLIVQEWEQHVMAPSPQTDSHQQQHQTSWNLDPPPPLRTQRLDASPSAAVDRQQRPQHRLEQTRGRQSNNTQSSNNTSYNLDYYYNADASLRQLVHGASPTTASISTTSPLATAPQLPVQPHTPSIDTWSVQLQRQITTLQQFVTTLAQEQRLVQHPPHFAASSSSVTSAAVVPPSVWEALADLQRLQQEIQKTGQ